MRHTLHAVSITHIKKIIRNRIRWVLSSAFYGSTQLPGVVSIQSSTVVYNIQQCRECIVLSFERVQSQQFQVKIKFCLHNIFSSYPIYTLAISVIEHTIFIIYHYLWPGFMVAKYLVAIDLLNNLQHIKCLGAESPRQANPGWLASLISLCNVWKMSDFVRSI